MVAGVVDVTLDRYRDLLTPTPGASALGRSASTERYPSSALWGENVLLIDGPDDVFGELDSLVPATGELTWA